MAQFTLATTLAVAGALKIRQQTGARELWEATGFPVRVPWRSLPGVEIAAAAGVLLGDAIAWLATLALLVVMTAVLLRASARGYRDDCGCLGNAPGRIGPTVVLRNLVLMVLAAGGLSAAALCGGVRVWEHDAPLLGTAVAFTTVLAAVYLWLVYAERLLAVAAKTSHPEGE